MNYETAVVRALEDIARELKRIRLFLTGEDRPIGTDRPDAQQEGDKKDA